MKNSNVLSLGLCLLAMFAITASFAQEQKKRVSPPEKSEVMFGMGMIEINYHSPAADGRKVMGELVPYGEVWRTGANNATTIEFTEAIKVGGKDLAAGKYEFFTIPGEKEWTFIFQKATGQWGAYSYKEENDVLRVTAKPKATSEFVESLRIGVDNDGIFVMWENTKAAVKIN